MPAITRDHIDLALAFLATRAESPTLSATFTETEYVAFRFGGISPLRAARLIHAARQNKTTADVRRIMDRADTLKTKLADDLAKLAEKRLVEWRRALHVRFPRLHGKITFGMGSEYVGVGANPKKTKQVDHDRKGLMLQDALEDVWEITDGYKLACPEDFTF